uniref:Macaca fascicularis brain cDNA clone: QmoA-10746, similar to human sideroflexin 1 (SFXN1), mRNA, RefSeq: NM_022754.4 n=1 Tax=Macaca fascicularis TaxID=9541 RepID=I7G892_MACFA|nr:unnamed protein product [Macaca fascicularis]
MFQSLLDSTYKFFDWLKDILLIFTEVFVKQSNFFRL